MGWISYTNESKKRDRKGRKKDWINSRWVWFIGQGNKNISVSISSSPSFGWGLSTSGCEGDVLLQFWFIFTFYINFSNVFPEWFYAKEYNQFSDEINKNRKSEYSSDGINKYWSTVKQTDNKKLKGRDRTKEKGWIRTGSRELSLRFHHYSMWWNIWSDDNSWSSRTPKFKRGSIDFQRLLKGRDKCESTLVEERFGEVKMPEGKYLCKINQKHYKRIYQRWPSKYWDIFEFEFGYYDDKKDWVITPVPHWGKGENSYDCGMDGTYSISLSSEVKSLEDANKKVIESCIRDREKYGNVDFSSVNGIENGIVRKNLIGEF